MMGDSVQHRIGHKRIGKDIGPIGNGPVAGEDNRFYSIPGIDNAVEIFGSVLVYFFKAKIINNQEINFDEFFDQFG